MTALASSSVNQGIIKVMDETSLCLSICMSYKKEGDIGAQDN